MDDKSGANTPQSGSSTPNPRFISQNVEADDRIKSQTYGLVQLSDFRKRRAEALGTEDQAGLSSSGNTSDTAKPVKKKKKKPIKKGVLSFGDDEEEDASIVTSSAKISPSNTPDGRSLTDSSTTPQDSGDTEPIRKKMTANSGVGFVAKSMTKSSLLKEAQIKDQLRKEFLAIQERVKATEFLLPFVFYDGTDMPGGVCRMKKGDQVWLFLDRARKVGAELSNNAGKSMRQWARVSVDDLMLVRGDLIIPNHYDFYHFMANKSIGYYGPLLPHSAEPTSTTPAVLSEVSTAGGLSVPDAASKAARSRDQPSTTPDSQLEGYQDDPGLTKVVDRRWYEKNKHIFPASTWEDFDPEKDYSTEVRKDAQGNAFFSLK